jgi:hypothetical protein
MNSDDINGDYGISSVLQLETLCDHVINCEGVFAVGEENHRLQKGQDFVFGNLFLFPFRIRGGESLPITPLEWNVYELSRPWIMTKWSFQNSRYGWLSGLSFALWQCPRSNNQTQKQNQSMS